jgi:DNA-directed RNA polymerase
VKLNERLYDMVVSDKLQSFHATTTRYKPMIIPPKPWQAINSGAYLFLRSELIRYHGCNMQKVRTVCSWGVLAKTCDCFPSTLIASL